MASGAKEAGDVITTIRDSSNYKPPYKNPYPYDDLEVKEEEIAIPD
ncbi:2582_t:CDS:2 [Entrophospora sp. SA101]|nr:2582_t:CDS:2 [Entrophospora sp. SA101]CAJ0842821.1 4716_t:CDS:2 [Entrophospora sp. SA101]CAJ0875067.1 6847_t:CDS:2 [Entrophospora sp. SA101]